MLDHLTLTLLIATIAMFAGYVAGTRTHNEEVKSLQAEYTRLYAQTMLVEQPESTSVAAGCITVLLLVAILVGIVSFIAF